MPIEIPTEKKRKAWAHQLTQMPVRVRKVAEKFDPWGRYLMPDTGQIVRIESFNPDGTMVVWTDPEFNDDADPRTNCLIIDVPARDLTPWRQPLDG